MLEDADRLAGEHGYRLPISPHTVVLTNQFIAKSGDGCCYGFEVYNSKVSQQFVLRFDRTSVPANGAVPDMIYPVAASTTVAIDFLGAGLTFYQGFVLCNSSTDTTLTIGSADCWFSARVV